MRNGVQEGGAAALPEHAGHALQVRADAEQTHDQGCVCDEVPSGDDAAHWKFCGRNCLGTPLTKHILGHGNSSYLARISGFRYCKNEIELFTREKFTCELNAWVY